MIRLVIANLGIPENDFGAKKYTEKHPHALKSIPRLVFLFSSLQFASGYMSEQHHSKRFVLRTLPYYLLLGNTSQDLIFIT